jgi:glycosyltransferase 2 family protein
MHSRRSFAIRAGWTAAGLGLGAGLAWVGLRGVELGDVWTAVRRSEWGWLPPAVALLVLATAIRALRWQLLFAPSTRPPLGPVSIALLVGLFFNVVLPFRAGEAARLMSLHRRAGTSRTEIAATVVIERVYDVAGLLLLLFAALPWLPRVTWLKAVAWVALAFGLAIAMAIPLLALREERATRLLLALARVLPVSVERRRRATRNFMRGLGGFRSMRTGLVAAVLTAASLVVYALCFWVVTLAFDLGLPFGAGVLVTVTTGLALVLPAPPAGLGVYEAAAVGALGAYGLSVTQALPYALVVHAVNVLPYVAAGAAVLPFSAKDWAAAEASGVTKPSNLPSR